MSAQLEAKFLKYWRTLQDRVNLIVGTVSSSKAKWPEPKMVASQSGMLEISLPKPLAIYNALPKASSGRSGLNHRYLILIDGTFTYHNENLIKTTCHLAIYSQKDLTDSSVTLALFDAMHFDAESMSNLTAYHPIFHVQRGRSNTMNDSLVKELYIDHFHRLTDVTVTSTTETGTPYLRLPTPQMDLFSVIAVTIADFYCNPGDRSSAVKQRFTSLLEHLNCKTNLARQSEQSSSLYQKFVKQEYSASAHWYPEFTQT